MDGNLGPLPGYSPSTPARILVAEYDSSMLDSIGALSNDALEIDYDFCTSRDQAVRKILASPYNLIISGVYLAELDDFFLAKQCRANQSSAPLLVTAKASDNESARQALTRGAFDVIANPLNIDQSCASIRLALWQSKLNHLIVMKEKAVNRFRQHLADYPSQMKGDEAFHRSVASIEKTLSSYKTTMDRIEKSLLCFVNLASDVQKQTRERALKRLEEQSRGF